MNGNTNGNGDIICTHYRNSKSSSYKNNRNSSNNTGFVVHHAIATDYQRIGFTVWRLGEYYEFRAPKRIYANFRVSEIEGLG